MDLANHLSHNKKMMKKVTESRMKLMNKLDALSRTNKNQEHANSQTLWKAFKDKAREIGKAYSKESRPKIAKCIEMLMKDLHQLSNHPNLDTDNSIHFNKALLASELAHLEKTRVHDHKDNMRSSLTDQGEKLGGAWSVINKDWCYDIHIFSLFFSFI